jgi:high-affinity iron transporter
VIDDSSRSGGLLAAFTGYRARPALLPLVLLAVYWVSVVLLLRRASRPKPAL